MSDYEDQLDGTNVICPYCKYEYQPEAEDFSEDIRDEECGECGRHYQLYQSFEVDHRTTPDCKLNNEEHVWETHRFRDGTSHDFCAVCDRCRGTG